MSIRRHHVKLLTGASEQVSTPIRGERAPQPLRVTPEQAGKPLAQPALEPGAGPDTSGAYDEAEVLVATATGSRLSAVEVNLQPSLASQPAGDCVAPRMQVGLPVGKQGHVVHVTLVGMYREVPFDEVVKAVEVEVLLAIGWWYETLPGC